MFYYDVIFFYLQILDAIDSPSLQRLEQPELCPKNYYDLMLKCWDHEPENRPTFSEMYIMLPQVGILIEIQYNPFLCSYFKTWHLDLFQSIFPSESFCDRGGKVEAFQFVCQSLKTLVMYWGPLVQQQRVRLQIERSVV